MERIAEFLQPPVYVAGSVIKGFQRGRELNCKTANVDPKSYTEELLALPEGVYWCFAKRAGEKKIHGGVCSFGVNPTFKDVPLTLEVHIFNEFKEDFYNETLQVLIVGFMRKMWAFQSLEALVEWIDGDKEYAKSLLSQEQSKELLKDNAYF